jgi:hypothetical protein
MTMRCIAGGIYSTSPEIQMVYRVVVQHEKARISNKVARAFPVSTRKLSQCSKPQFSVASQDNIESHMKLHSNFDHKLWWKAHGDIVRYLLNDGNEGSDVELVGDLSKSSSRVTFPRNRYDETYATDAVYQDLFIDSPPCRDTLKLSFELINRYWEIKIIEWNPPILMTANSNCKMEYDDINNNERSINHQKSDYFDKNIDVEAMVGERPRISHALFLRVPYTAKQRPRFSFLPSTFHVKFPSFSVLMGKFFEFEYEGWIDLYVRPVSSPTTISADVSCGDDNACNDYGSSNWKVYRHDDRLRVYPPIFFAQYIQGINEHMNGGNAIDALTLIEKTAFISTIFQWFRLAHGMAVQHFAKKNIQTESRTC